MTKKKHKSISKLTKSKPKATYRAINNTPAKTLLGQSLLAGLNQAISGYKKKPKAAGYSSGQKKRWATERAWVDNGLVKPDVKAPAIGTPAFERLRKQWYVKLAKSEQEKINKIRGKAKREAAEANKFVDLEWAENPDSAHIKLPASRGRMLTPGKQLYYAMGRNFLTHFKFRSAMEKEAWAMHINGKGFRKIHKHLKATYGLKKSLYWVFYFVKKTAAKCKKFNTSHKEGLLNAANADSYASDVLISDFMLQSADNLDEDYGMQVDRGFWESVPKPK